MSLLESSLNFTKFMVALQKVERAIYIPGEDRKENDAEHSYQLAMLAWYLIQKQGDSGFPYVPMNGLIRI